MRIIGGEYKGKRFQLSGKTAARPTTDFAKEALFNIIENSHYIDELSVLDLFAGIGSITLEFASRGCPDVWAVESNRRQIKFIEKMSEELGFGSEIKPIQADVFKFLNTCQKSFNLIFADPPYHLENAKKLPELLLNSSILSPSGVFILEHHKSADYSDFNHFVKVKKYGNVHFSFFER